MTQAAIGPYPDPTFGSTMAQNLLDFQEAYKTNQSGPTRPGWLAAGGLYTKTGVSPTVMLYDGTSDIALLSASGGTIQGELAVSASARIVAEDNTQTRFYFGLLGGERRPSFFVNGVFAGAVSPTGIAAENSQTLMTREKGDSRYQQTSSTLRYKDNARPLTEDEIGVLIGALSVIHAHAWTWGGDLPEDDARRGTIGMGAIAEHVHDALTPEWREAFVTYDAQDRPSGLNSHSAVALLIEVNRLQNARIAELTSRVEALEAA